MTLDKKKQLLEKYYETELAILNSQEYQMGNTHLVRAKLESVRQARKELEQEIKQEQQLNKTGGRGLAFKVYYK